MHSPAAVTGPAYGGMDDAGSTNNQISDGAVVGAGGEFSMDFLQFMGIDPLTPQNTIKTLLAQSGEPQNYDNLADQNGSAGAKGDGMGGGGDDALNGNNSGDHLHAQAGPGSVEASQGGGDDNAMDMPMDGQEENGDGSNGAQGVQPLGPSQMMGLSHEAPFGIPRDMELGLAALFQGSNAQTDEAQAAQAALLQHQVSTAILFPLSHSQALSHSRLARADPYAVPGSL